jgi:pimeloyl-ACP methyl ester carboxylesterase
MTTLPARSTGTGPTILLVHGVGLGSQHLRLVADHLSSQAHVVVPDRPGYGKARDLPVRTLDEQIDDLVDTLDVAAPAARPAVYVGVSGGATLGIRVLARHPKRFRAAVLHEPLLGSFAPELQSRVRAAAARLATDSDRSASVAFVRQLIGPEAWDALDRHDVEEIERLDPIVRHEVAAFARIDFTLPELHRLRTIDITTTVGRASSDPRHDAAVVFAELAGARVRQIPGEHFAPITAPDALAAAVIELLDPAEESCA